jgi:hypothetical protein
MKTKIILFSLMTFIFAGQMKAQDRNKVYAMNNEISDNLDLRAVADIFGESRNLQDFERRLNNPELQISNLDLNNDNEVDYLRVIETVENRTHVIIIQSVLDRDVYQDVATIDVEKDNYNRIYVQVVGNEFMYGPNYIYEPVYYSTPLIYASFWSYNYRPYVSSWYWNYYPSYYYAWRPYPVYRYRNNIQISLNINNYYNYVSYRRSNQAVVLYNSRRSNWYERQYPNYAFSRRNTNVTNRYELDRRRESKNSNYRNEIGYYQTRNKASRDNSSRSADVNRNYSQKNATTSRPSTSQRTENQRAYTPNTSRQNAPQRTENQRAYTPSNSNASRQNMPQRTENQRAYTPNNSNASRQNVPQRSESQRAYTPSNSNASRQNVPQRSESQRAYTPSNSNASRQSAPQRSESQRVFSQNNSNTSRENAPQRTGSQDNSSSRSERRR